MDDAVKLHKQGLSVSDIAKKLGISAGRVYQLFRTQGYKLPKFNSARGVKRLWTDEEIAYLKENLDKPASVLASELNRTHSAIVTKLYKLDAHTHYYCVVCEKEISQKGTYCTEHNWIARSIAGTKNRCKKIGREYSLSTQQAISLLLGKCIYCGEEGGGIDRVDSSKGYTVENTVSCCSVCNTMKLDLSKEDWIKKMRAILENLDGE